MLEFHSTLHTTGTPMLDEYVSDPKLAILAKELSILNAKLVREGIPGDPRIRRLRHFANASRFVKGFVGVVETKGVYRTGEDRYQATFNGKKVGCFSTESEAKAAVRQAHVEHYGPASPFHPDYLGINNGDYAFDLDDDGNEIPMPSYVRELSGKFSVRVGGKMVAGPFVTFDEAVSAAYLIGQERKRPISFDADNTAEELH